MVGREFVPGAYDRVHAIVNQPVQRSVIGHSVLGNQPLLLPLGNLFPQQFRAHQLDAYRRHVDDAHVVLDRQP